MTVKPDNEGKPNWTIGYRKPKANRLQRATNWSGTWREAVDMASKYREFTGTTPKELEVWYITTRQAELDGYVHLEDIGNLLTNSGKRIPIVDNGTLPAELL